MRGLATPHSSEAPSFKNGNSVSLEGVSSGCRALVHTGLPRQGPLLRVTAQTHGKVSLKDKAAIKLKETLSISY